MSAVALGLAAAIVWGLARDAEPERRGEAEGSRHEGVSAAAIGTGADGVAAVRLDDAAPLRAGLRPRSLRGSRVDGGLAVDERGDFVPTIDARRLFDYFLAAGGEESPDRLRARIVAEIERRLDGEAAAAAVLLLDRYLAYRERARALDAVGTGAADLDARLAELSALRRDVLGDEAAAAFFAAEEAEVARAIARRRILENPDLDTGQVRAQLDALDADQPPEVRERGRAAALAVVLRAEEARLRTSGADPAEIREMRERLAGPEAAARLADLDRRRALWSERVERYRAERARIEQDPSLDAAARAAAAARLLDSSFTGPERLRVAALDRIAVQGGSSAGGRP